MGQRQQASRQRQFQLVADAPLINMKDCSWRVNECLASVRLCLGLARLLSTVTWGKDIVRLGT